MADFPIIFSAPMVLALLAGRKTQTRRLPTSIWRKVKPSDRLWVRENFRVQQTSTIATVDGGRQLICIDYAADDA